MGERAIGLVAVMGICGLFGWGCVSDDSSVTDASTDQSTGSDVPAPPVDSGVDAPVDSPVEAASPYNDLADPKNWTIFNLASIADGGANLGGYNGGTFDGRYVYFAPFNDGAGFHGKVGRYDTQGPFTSAASWTFVDLPTLGLDANARGYVGATFDGRWIYFVPQVNPNFHGLTVRYDTTAPFTSLSSWEKFDLATANGNAICFNTAVFDGKSIYYSPNARTLIAKYDTTQVFTNATGWTFFDPTTLFGAGAQGYGVGGFDTKYVYFVPTFQTSNTTRSIFLRYDKSMAFGDSAAWASFDSATGIDPTAKSFWGTVFDGRYLTMAPWNNGTGPDGVAIRFDTTLSFTDQSSWSRFDTSTVASTLKGFSGANFDGKYVYFLPTNNGTPDGVIGRFDPATWSSASSWTTFDLSGLNATAKQYGGSVFDGHYLYLVPSVNGVVARFEARTTPITVDPKQPASVY